MRTVRLVRGVVFLLFSYLVCLSWVLSFLLLGLPLPPLGLSLGFFVLLLGLFSCLGFFLGFFLGFALPLRGLWVVVAVGVVLFPCVFLPPGVFPGGLVAFGLCGFF